MSQRSSVRENAMTSRLKGARAYEWAEGARLARPPCTILVQRGGPGFFAKVMRGFLGKVA
jgi:hypothetical protein